VRKATVFILLTIGAFFGLIWWFDVEQAGGSFSDFFGDPVGQTQSLFSKISALFSGWFQQASGAIGGNVNSVTLAANKIAGFESFSAKAYPDPAGQTATYSIGYGHQIVPGDGFTTASTISETDALALLQADLDVYVNCVNNAVTVPLNPQQQAALYSLCYNIGCNAFENSSLLGDLNNGDYASAQAQFAVWNQAGGEVLAALSKRRADEAALFGSGGTLVDASDASIAADENA